MAPPHTGAHVGGTAPVPATLGVTHTSDRGLAARPGRRGRRSVASTFGLPRALNPCAGVSGFTVDTYQRRCEAPIRHQIAASDWIYPAWVPGRGRRVGDCW